MNCSESIYKNWFRKISKKKCNQLNQNNRENSENKLGFYDASNNIFYEVQDIKTYMRIYELLKKSKSNE